MDTTLGTEVNARNRQAMPQSGTTVAEEQSKRKSKVSQGGHPDSVANIAKGESVTNRAGESVSPNHRPTRDSFVRETPEDRASYGFYKFPTATAPRPFILKSRPPIKPKKLQRKSPRPIRDRRTPRSRTLKRTPRQRTKKQAPKAKALR